MDRAGSVTAELMEEVRDARDSAERVRLIARDLKIFSRGEETQRGPVDVEAVLESTLRMASNELRHRARVVRDYGHVPPVHANASRVGQVLLNLIINAAQSIPEGDQARNEVRVATAVDSATGRVIISVSDTGSGIPPEVQRRLFTPFVTTKPSGVGTGLGLSICHRIVTALDGTIEFSTEVGKGTTFRVSFPLAASGAPSPEAPPAMAVQVSRRRGRVLVVDDEVMIAQVLRRVLSRHHDVRVVSSAQMAMELFVAGERFDVVLCDLMMPQITGMDLHALLVGLDRAQADRIIFMTGGAFTPAARAFVDRVPNHVIEKPFEVQALLALVNRVVV
jgi:CheY-like chemotaxis protein